jgi:hypothetical protein
MNTLEYIQEKKFTSHAELVEDFKNYGIKVNHSPDKKLYLLSTSKTCKYSGNIDKYLSECNGLVMSAPQNETSDWKIKVVPVPTLKGSVSANKIEKFMAHELYNITEVREGTVISLYFFDGEWRMSTARGVNVTNLKWDGMTYKQYFNEVLVEKKINVTKFYNSLNKERAYTLGFKHHARHPFTYNHKFDLWFIHCTVNGAISTINPFTQTTGSASTETKVDIKDASTKLPWIIPSQKLIKNIDLRTGIFRSIQDSLRLFLTDLKENRTPTISFGYILRSKDPSRTKENSNIILESRLMQKIRKLYYHGDFLHFSRHLGITRKQYVIMNSFLNQNNHRGFKALFPQFKPEFTKFKKCFRRLRLHILGLLGIELPKGKDKSTFKTAQTAPLTPTSETKSEDEYVKYQTYAKRILTNLKTIYTFENQKNKTPGGEKILNSDAAINVISTYLLHTNHLPVLASLVGYKN